MKIINNWEALSYQVGNSEPVNADDIETVIIDGNEYPAVSRLHVSGYTDMGHWYDVHTKKLHVVIPVLGKDTEIPVDRALADRITGLRIKTQETVIVTKIVGE